MSSIRYCVLSLLILGLFVSQNGLSELLQTGRTSCNPLDKLRELRAKGIDVGDIFRRGELNSLPLGIDYSQVDQFRQRRAELKKQGLTDEGIEKQIDLDLGLNRLPLPLLSGVFFDDGTGELITDTSQLDTHAFDLRLKDNCFLHLGLFVTDIRVSFMTTFPDEINEGESQFELSDSLSRQISSDIDGEARQEGGETKIEFIPNLSVNIPIESHIIGAQAKTDQEAIDAFVNNQLPEKTIPENQSLIVKRFFTKTKNLVDQLEAIIAKNTDFKEVGNCRSISIKDTLFYAFGFEVIDSGGRKKRYFTKTAIDIRGVISCCCTQTDQIEGGGVPPEGVTVGCVTDPVEAREAKFNSFGFSTELLSDLTVLPFRTDVEVTVTGDWTTGFKVRFEGPLGFYETVFFSSLDKDNKATRGGGSVSKEELGREAAVRSVVSGAEGVEWEIGASIDKEVAERQPGKESIVVDLKQVNPDSHGITFHAPSSEGISGGQCSNPSLP